jgi:septum formation protein
MRKLARGLGALRYYLAMGLILASASPRRKELLAQLGLEFSVLPSVELDEARVLRDLHGDLSLRLRRLAQLKGGEIARQSPTECVISADTVVVLDGVVLGKPRDHAHAFEMLTRLSGRTHEVITAVAVQWVLTDYLRSDTETTQVTFDRLDPGTIQRYLEAAQPFDMAGSYGIQGLGALLVAAVHGCYSNVVGLPLRLTARLLEGAGMAVL